MTVRGWGLNTAGCRRGCAGTSIRRSAVSATWSTADTKVTASIIGGVGTTLLSGTGRGCGLAKGGMARDDPVMYGMARDDLVVMCDMAGIGMVKGDVAMDVQKSIRILVDVVNGSDVPCIASGKVVSLTTKF